MYLTLLIHVHVGADIVSVTHVHVTRHIYSLYETGYVFSFAYNACVEIRLRSILNACRVAVEYSNENIMTLMNIQFF